LFDAEGRLARIWLKYGRHCAAGFGFQRRKAAALQLDRDAAVLYAGDVSHTPIRKRFVGIVQDHEFADHPIAYRELNRFFEVQKHTASTHIRRSGAESLTVLAQLDAGAGFDQKTQFSSVP